MFRQFLCLLFIISFFIKCNAFQALSKPIKPLKLLKLKMMMKMNKEELLIQIQKNYPINSRVVIKYGGHAMESEELSNYFCEDIASLYSCGIQPIVVHGGGPQIKATLASLSIESQFIDGLRVTDTKTMEVAQMVLCGMINKNIVGTISRQKGIRGAIGLSGRDAKLLQAKQIDKKFGLVGEPTIVDDSIITDLLNINMIPVIAPVAIDMITGNSLNVNADTAAGAVAKSLSASSLLLMTDIEGVLDKNKQLITKIESSSFQTLKDDGVISGGMIPKLENAVDAACNGVKEVSILDGRVRYALLKSLADPSFGTKIVK